MVIPQAIVQLAHHLSAQIVCQGVESMDQLELLQQWGCDLGQGYLFAEPLDISELHSFLLNAEACDAIRGLRSKTFPVLATNAQQPILLSRNTLPS